MLDDVGIARRNDKQQGTRTKRWSARRNERREGSSVPDRNAYPDAIRPEDDRQPSRGR